MQSSKPFGRRNVASPVCEAPPQRKRSLLAPIAVATVAAGAIAYAAAPGGGVHGGGLHGFFFFHGGASASAPASSSTAVARGGFGATGAAHSAGS